MLSIPVSPLPAFADNYIWTWVNGDAHTLTVVDPGDATPVIAYAKQHRLTLEAILLTHHHLDHIGGVPDLLNEFPSCQVYGPVDSRIPWVTCGVSGHQTILIDTLSFQIMPIPGHTSTHIAYYEAAHGWLFCGDTLFSAGCGRVFDGSLEELYASLGQLMQLPDTTQIFCGHEYTQENLAFAAIVEPRNQFIHAHQLALTNLGACSLPSLMKTEKQINPFLRTKTGDFREFAQQHDVDLNDEFALFKALREEKTRLGSCSK